MYAASMSQPNIVGLHARANIESWLFVSTTIFTSIKTRCLVVRCLEIDTEFNHQTSKLLLPVFYIFLLSCNLLFQSWTFEILKVFHFPFVLEKSPPWGSKYSAYCIRDHWQCADACWCIRLAWRVSTNDDRKLRSTRADEDSNGLQSSSLSSCTSLSLSLSLSLSWFISSHQTERKIQTQKDTNRQLEKLGKRDEETRQEKQEWRMGKD